ncbi:MAG: glutamyl-tRNA reductase [Bacteroidota bacterium]|nr:glutamyl-tRNA reductase [Bacteroidota bacterium]
MISNCFVIGFNHHHADVSERSYYAISEEQKLSIFQEAKEINFPSLVIINTCNRTEIFGYGDMETAIKLYAKHTLNDFILKDKMMKLTGREAIDHMFKVGSGLDSQIIGDLEILGQFKNAFHTAKKHHLLNGYFERLANHCVQASKEIRSNTELSGGTISLSYAIVKFLKDRDFIRDKKVLIIGAGEFGKGIAQNIKSHFPLDKLYLSNRTESKARILAEKLSCNWFDFKEIPTRINDFDIIITAVSNAKNYLVEHNMIVNGNRKLFFDMSVPRAIDPSLNSGENELITVDDASSLINHNIENRKSQLPLALDILNKHLAEFIQWSEIYEKSDSIKTWKSLIVQLSMECPHINNLESHEKTRIIGKRMSHFANYVKSKNNLPKEPEKIIDSYLFENPGTFKCKTSFHTCEVINNCRSCSGTY